MPTSDQADMREMIQSDVADDDSQSLEQTVSNEANDTPEEEVEFRKLSGNAQERIRQLIRRAKEAETRAAQVEMLASQRVQVPMPPQPQVATDDERAAAVRKLQQAGLATIDDVRQLLNEQLSGLSYVNTVSQLEKEYSGQDGRPAFSKVEYEDFVRTNPQYQGYQPEDVYKIMYHDELIDWELAKRQNRTTNTSLKPTSRGMQVAQDTEWTPEYIDKMIREKGPSWYDKNQDKIHQVLNRFQQG